MPGKVQFQIILYITSFATSQDSRDKYSLFPLNVTKSIPLITKYSTKLYKMVTNSLKVSSN